MCKGPERMERVLHGAQGAGIWPELAAGLGSVWGWTQESRASRLWDLFGALGSHRRIRLCFKMMILDPSEVMVE